MPKKDTAAMPETTPEPKADQAPVEVAPASPVPEHVIEEHYKVQPVCKRCGGCQSVDSVKGLPWNRRGLVIELPGVRTGVVYPVECPDCKVPVVTPRKK